MTSRRLRMSDSEIEQPVLVSDMLLEVMKVAFTPGNAFYPSWAQKSFSRENYRSSYLRISPGAFSSFQAEAQIKADDANYQPLEQIDFLYILSGSLTLDLSDGREILLKAGDIFVLNDFLLGWRNSGIIPVTAIAVTVDSD